MQRKAAAKNRLVITHYQERTISVISGAAGRYWQIFCITLGEVERVLPWIVAIKCIPVLLKARVMVFNYRTA